MIEQFKAFFNLFRQGKELTNAGVWKQRTIAANLIAGFLMSGLVIAKGFGYDVQIDQATVDALAGGVAAAAVFGNAVMHAITSARAGLPTSSESAADGNP